MARTQGRRQNDKEAKSEALLELEGFVSSGAVSEGWRLDGTLLAAAIQQTSRAGAALQIGTTMDRQTLTLKIWDGGFPVTMRADDEESASLLLKRIALAYCPKDERWDAWRKGIEEYG